MEGMSRDGDGTLPAPGAGPWTLEERGSFRIGHCSTCGYVSPARRSRSAAEQDLTGHECCVGPGAPLGTGPLEAADIGTRGYRGPTRVKG
jgi:hypothetical protein